MINSRKSVIKLAGCVMPIYFLSNKNLISRSRKLNLNEKSTSNVFKSSEYYFVSEINIIWFSFEMIIAIAKAKGWALKAWYWLRKCNIFIMYYSSDYYYGNNFCIIYPNSNPIVRFWFNEETFQLERHVVEANFVNFI